MTKSEAMESSRQLSSGRFVLHRRLGEGGYGVVYAAFDKERGIDVALKVLTHVDAQALYRFKQEFRALADVRHPNLIGLHELFAEDDLWFFTMELVSGVRFSDYVRQRDPVVFNESTEDLRNADTMKVMLDFGDDVPEVSAQPMVDEGRLDVDRLRRTLPQLVEGISALHQAGTLHCDLKPSNVLVTPEGRVVVLDFGLVREAATGQDATSAEGTTAGTPSFMSPEHARGHRLAEASDWYSVGVMLFEALTGQLPFAGPPMLVLTTKTQTKAPAPSELVPNVPEDLEALCTDLLAIEPKDRPGRDALRARAKARPAEDAPPRMLVGREAEIGELEAAFARVVKGGSERVLLHGPPGAGKSTLLRTFLDRLPEGVVLASRCYEQESMPYKGIDGVVDALTRRLLSMSEEEQARVLGADGRDGSYGADGAALAQVFPVLRTVTALHEIERPTAIGDRAVRVRAVAALRHILERLAERDPIVLCIDDAHWIDKDSADVLEQIFGKAAPPRTLLLATSRQSGSLAGAREIALGLLAERACRDMAARMLGVTDPRVERIAREGRGDPLLVETLCRDVRERGEIDPGEATLETAVTRRLERLDPEVRRLFELVACAGTPIDSGTLARAAGDAQKCNVHLAELCSRRLLKVRSARAATIVEAAHDRLRDVVLARLPSYARRVHHSALAEVLESVRGVTDELLAVHWQAAGDDVRAAERFARAALMAERVLAFDRAARLYRQALQMTPRSRAAPLYGKLGEALENAGHERDAAQAFLSAAALLGGKGIEAGALEKRAQQALVLGPSREATPP